VLVLVRPSQKATRNPRGKSSPPRSSLPRSVQVWGLNLTPAPQDCPDIYKGSLLLISSDGAPSLLINGGIIIGTRT